VEFDIHGLQQQIAELKETLKEQQRQLLASSQRPENELFTFFYDLKEPEERGTATFSVPMADVEERAETDRPEPAETDQPEPAGDQKLQAWGETRAGSGNGLSEPDEEPSPNTYKPKKSLKKATFRSDRTARASFPSLSKPEKTVHRQTTSAETKTKRANRTNPRGQLTIQVAAVKSAGIADDMVTQLKGQGYQAHQSVAKIPGKGLRYRIRVGRFTNSQEAQALARRLKNDSYDAIIVNR
jgi:cell division septation protein DedD